MSVSLDVGIVPTYNPKTLAIADLSIYGPSGQVSAPTLEITPPGFGKVALPFIPRAVNIFNSNNLKITDTLDTENLVPLPDGIWRLKYSIAPSLQVFVNRKYLRTDQLQTKYLKTFLTIDLSESDCASELYCLPRKNHAGIRKIEKLREIELMINGAISAGNLGEDIYATELYKRANRLIELVTCTKC